MIVTCYYDIYNSPERFPEYFKLFYNLAISGISIIVFTSPNLVDIFNILINNNNLLNVNIIGKSLEEFELYSIANSYTGELPINRNNQKDTKEFLSLMNTKTEFILEASKIFKNENNFIWLDFGILKIIQNKINFIEKITNYNKINFDKIIIPGCWQFGRPFSVDNVNWRFCGGLIIVPRNLIRPFYEHSKNVLKDFCTLPFYKLTWETNVWNIVEVFALKDDIIWYLADHNDSIINNIDNILTNH